MTMNRGHDDESAGARLGHRRLLVWQDGYRIHIGHA